MPASMSRSVHLLICHTVWQVIHLQNPYVLYTVHPMLPYHGGTVRAALCSLNNTTGCEAFSIAHTTEHQLH
jgi:hypothetical protein